jgi:predicted secreted protein
MVQAAQFGLGTVLRISIASVMTDVPYCQSITGPDETFDIIDVTTHSSTGGYREKITGLADGGELTVTLNWHPEEASHAALQAALTARELTAFQLSWSALTDYATDNLMDFDGYVSGLTRASPIDAQITRDLTITITGPVDVSTE